MKKHIKITLNGPTPEVVIDGEPIPEAVAVFVDGRQGCGHHQVRIGCDFETIEVDGVAKVSITEKTKQTLIELGWAPPSTEAGA